MSQIEHLINENVRLKQLLGDIVTQYGDRPTHLDGLFTRDFQPILIQQAMDASGITGDVKCQN